MHSVGLLLCRPTVPFRMRTQFLLAFKVPFRMNTIEKTHVRRQVHRTANNIDRSSHSPSAPSRCTQIRHRQINMETRYPNRKTKNTSKRKSISGIEFVAAMRCCAISHKIKTIKNDKCVRQSCIERAHPKSIPSSLSVEQVNIEWINIDSARCRRSLFPHFRIESC